MKRAHRVLVRACSWFAGHTGRAIIGWAVVWMASAPRPGWSQSAWPSYPNNNAISIASGGNVGIGTSLPGSTLEINDLQASSTTGTGHKLRFSFGGTPLFGWRVDGTNDTLILDKNWASCAPALSIVRVNGNVGIGTTNPQHLLHVAGTIGAEEVLVTSTGADYVFRPGYRLQPLAEIDSYIQANHHLPDIPSEAEVKQNGMGVGEMETKLLAKIEELTLHMIQEHERNDRLEQQNRDLQEQIREVQGRLAVGETVRGANQ